MQVESENAMDVEDTCLHDALDYSSNDIYLHVSSHLMFYICHTAQA